MLRELYWHGNPGDVSAGWWDTPTWDIMPSLTPVMTHLTSMTLNLQCDHNSDTSRLESLHRALSGAQDLIHLDIRGHQFTLEDTQPTSLTPFQLPKLQTYHVEAGFAGSVALLSLAEVPDKCLVFTGFYLESEPSTDEYTTLLDTLRERLRSICTLEVASRTVPDSHLVLSGWQSRSCLPLLEDYTKDGEPREAQRHAADISIAFCEAPASMAGDLELHRQALIELFSSLARSRSLPELRNLSFRVAHSLEYASPDWHLVRDSFPRLEWLRVDQHVAETFLDWQKEDSGQLVLLSRLTHLMVTAIPEHSSRWDGLFSDVLKAHGVAEDEIESATPSRIAFSMSIGSQPYDDWEDPWALSITPPEEIPVEFLKRVREEDLLGM
ncbi:hypothetical protein PENSPDRAFT_443761 [Peniophora sp. CONT]|nr:hypothetical protein PENSPDRAFT_443761 [Peniophora sp. CONT]